MIRLFTSLVFTVFICCALPAQVVSIAQARSLSLGATVTVRGIVTNSGELGKIRYLQDGTAGIAAYPGTGSTAGFEISVSAGDSIEVTGTLVDYHELLEISPISAFQVISTNNPLPAPKTLSLAGLADNLESQLLSIPCVAFYNAGPTFAGSGAYAVTDATGNSAKVYLPYTSPLIGTNIPPSSVFLTCILSAYDDFQLLPRTPADILAGACFSFSGPPDQTDIQTNSMTVSWQTNLNATATLRYGANPNALTNVADIFTSAQFQFYQLAGLQAGTIYWVQIEAKHNGSSVFSEKRPFATRSLSSGQVKVFFNHSIDESIAGGLLPEGQSAAEVIAETIARIDAAAQTIDVAMYNNNRMDLTSALVDANARGVRVRYVAAAETASSALQPPPPFSVVYGNSISLMHNKFLVIDANLSDKAWVMNGSLNWTNGNINNDFNNTLFIQDQSLARAYELEFEEMWGSKEALPNVALARFGPAKFDDTPHHFIIGGTAVESYFSPSDRVTARLTETLSTTNYEALFALLTFTKDEPADVLADAFFNGAQVRGMIENTGDVGSEYPYFTGLGMSVQKHSFGGVLHHKYGVIDAGYPGSDPTVITGSHNWTFNAETANDENTLVLHSADLATLYKAEFEQRWTENNLSATTLPAKLKVGLYPNPVAGKLFLEVAGLGALTVRDGLGRACLQERLQDSGLTRLDVSGLAPGFYYVIIRTTDGLATVPFQKI